jgi:hypothetical protein
MVRGGAGGGARESEGKFTEIKVGVSTSAPRRGNAEEMLALGVGTMGRLVYGGRKVASKPNPLRDGKGHRGK